MHGFPRRALNKPNSSMWKSIISTTEAEHAKTIYKELQSQHTNHKLMKKVAPVIDKIYAKNIEESFVNEALAKLFELRFFHRLTKSQKIAGEIEHEFEALQGSKSSVDFRFSSSGKNCLIELTSVRHSESLKNECCFEEGSFFSFHSGSKELGAEIKRVQSILIGKLYNDKRTEIAKFPIPTANDIHVLAIDMRGFNIVGKSDIYDYQSICYGPDVNNWNGNLQFNGNSIPGVFQDIHQEQRSETLRTRIHFILFFDEDFGDQQQFIVVPNPHFFKTSDDAKKMCSLLPF